VLVVENNDDLRNLLALTIDAEPDLRCIATSASARDLVRLARDERPDVVVLDLQLEDGLSLPVARELRDSVPGTSVLVYTGHANPALAAEAGRWGVREYVKKGGDVEDLLAAIRRCEKCASDAAELPSAPMDLQFRSIAPDDDPAVASLIRTVMPEFGAVGPGFAIEDPEVDHMSRAYDVPRAAYFVVVDPATSRVVGGGGIAPLAGEAPTVCELRKMYFLPEARGRGMGERLLRHCLDVARGFGYRTCYLETLAGMNTAVALYEKLGFRRLAAPLGATGHHGCNRYYSLEL
jgi:putative acetyltransferase